MNPASQSQALGIILIILFFFLIILITTSFILDVLYTYYIVYHAFIAILLLMLGIWISFNIVFNLIMAIVISPGNTDQFKNYSVADLEKIVNPYKIVKICNVCNAYKPERSHHCSICNKCVLRMDHHCRKNSWINNCVGHHNHRYFLLVIFYVLIGTAILSCLQLWKLFNPKFDSLYYSNNQSIQGILEFSRQLTYAFSFVLIFFVSFNWWLAMTGTTQIELWGMNLNQNDSRYQRNFSQPTINENLNIIFGTTSYLQMLLPSVKPLWHQGIIWHEPIKYQQTFETKMPHKQQQHSLNCSMYGDMEIGFSKLNQSMF